MPLEKRERGSSDVETSSSKRKKTSSYTQEIAVEVPARRSKSSQGSSRRKSTVASYAESSDTNSETEAVEDDSTPPPKKKRKSEPVSHANVIFKKGKTPVQRDSVGPVSNSPKSPKKAALKASKSMPSLSRSPKPLQKTTSLKLDGLGEKASKALLHCPDWSVRQLEQLVWTFVRIEPDLSLVEGDKGQCGVWWPAENLSFDADVGMTYTKGALHLQLLGDTNGTIWNYASASIVLDNPSRENVLPFRSMCGTTQVLTIDKKNYKVLPEHIASQVSMQPMVVIPVSSQGSPLKSSPSKSKLSAHSDDSSDEEDLDEEGFLPTPDEFSSARLNALKRDQEVTGLPDPTIAMQLDVAEVRLTQKLSRGRNYKMANPVSEDLEVEDPRLQYPVKVVANWPVGKHARYWPALITGCQPPAPVVKNEPRTRESMMCKYRVTWPDGFPKNARRFLYRNAFFINSEPQFHTVRLEEYKSIYVHKTEDIVAQLKPYMELLGKVIQGEYVPKKEDHLYFLSNSEMRRNDMDRQSGAAKGDYSDSHIKGVLLFLRAWVNQNVGGKYDVPERPTGSPEFEQLNSTSLNLYASAILLPTALELLVIEDSKQDEVPIPQRAAQAKEQDPSIDVDVYQHQLAAEELRKPNWMTSIVAERDMMAMRHQLLTAAKSKDSLPH